MGTTHEGPQLLPGAVSVAVVGNDSYRTVAVAGEIDDHTRGSVEAALAAPYEGELVLDLTRVTFMDSAGIHLLLAARERLGDRLSVVGVQRQGARLLTLCGMEHLVAA